MDSLQLETLAMNPIFIGALVGVVYHVKFQRPYQAGILETLWGYGILVFAFVVYHAIAFPAGIISFIKDFVIFDAAYITTALVLKTIYNVYFRHRGIPAKFMYAATDWTFWRDTQWGKPYEVIRNMHRELGDVVRIQPNEVVFNTTAALEDIYGHNTKTNKAVLYGLMVPKGYNASIATELDKPRHAFLRRLIAPSFSPASLKQLEITMNRYYEEFISGVGKRARENDGIVELNEWFHNLSFDIAGALTLGEDFGALVSGEQHFFIKALHGSFFFHSLFAPVAWLGPLLKALPPPKRVKETRWRIYAFTEKAVKNSLERGKVEQQKTILANISGAKDPETHAELSFKDLVTNMVTMLVAAADTSAVSLTFALYYIVSISRVYDRLTSEIRSKFLSVNEINGQSTAQLTYLDAVIMEALRIRPVASTAPPRVTPPEGMTIAGRYIAGNTTVSVPHWSILHNERYFSHPDSFIPERWIDSERGAETCVRDAWVPFSVGKWNCIGKPLAMMEMRVTIARLLWEFDVQLKDEGQEVPKYDHKSISAGQLDVRLNLVEK